MKKVNHCLIALPLLKQLNGLLSNCFAEREHDTRAASKDNQSRKEKNFPSPEKIRSTSRLFLSLETSRACLQKRNQIL